MKKWTLRLAFLLVWICLFLAAFVVAARSGWLTMSDTELRAKYSLPGSQFTRIDDQTVHFTDQGEGPAIVLMHGTYGSLRNWDDWVDALTPSYRVIRFDRPGMGLSDPAPDSRSGPEQALRIIRVLTEKLDVDRFFLVATSSAGTAGAAYAAANPQQVQGLILANIAIGDYTGRSERSFVLRMLLKADPWLGGWRSATFWREVLLINFHNDEKVSAEHAREWSELNNRMQGVPILSYPAPNTGFDTIQNLERMVVPTLLLWSAHDHERPAEVVGQLGLEKLASADKKLELVAHCGHIMPLDCGPESALIARTFFDRLSTP